MKILVVGLWDFSISSLGAQALSDGLLHILKKQFPNDEIVPLPFAKLGIIVRKLGYLLSLRNRWIYSLIFNFSYLIYLLLNISRRTFFNNADLLIVSGDGIVADIFWFDTLYLACDIKYAQTRNIKVITLNQSVNTQPGSFADFLVRKYFITNPIALREEQSYRYIKNIVESNKQNIQVYKCVDSAFFVPHLTEEEKKQFKLYADSIYEKYNLIPRQFCVVGIRGNRPPDQIIDLNAWASFIKQMRSIVSMPVIFASTCAEYDIPLAHKLKEYIDELIIIEELYDWQKYNYRFFLYLLKDSYLSVSDRYHQNVFSALCRTPFLPIQGNTSKTQGLIDLFEYPFDVLPLPQENNIRELTRELKRLIENRTQICELLAELDDRLSSQGQYERLLTSAVQSLGNAK